MATVKARQELPDAAKITADLVERLGFKWEFDYEYPLPDYRRRRAQIREEKHYTPTAQVTQFREAMRRGDKFPPVVVSKDGYLVDGNTRAAAAEKNGFPTIQALVLNEPYEGASQAVRRRMHVLGAGFNARNGKGIDPSEVRRAVEIIGEDSAYDATRIAYLLGVTEHTVQSFLAEKKARERAERVGLHANGSLPASQLRILGTARVNDGPWRELFTLAQASGMSPTELRPLVKSLRESGSDQKALAILEEEREARQEQIAEYTASNKSKPAMAAQLRQRLGFICGQEADPAVFAEHNRNLVEKHLAEVERAVAVLTAVAAAQRERAAATAA